MDESSASVSVTPFDDGRVAVVEVHRPPHNFFDLDTLSALAASIERLADGPTRVVVLCAEGKNFCGGADFSGAVGRSDADADARSPWSDRTTPRPHLYDVGIRLFEQPLPIVAAIQGAAIGGGLGLAMTADVRVAAPSSRFAANFALLGFHQGFGLSVTLPRVVGHQAALDLLYTGRRIDGATAQRIGLCDDLVADDQLRHRAMERAREIAAAAPLAIRSIRQTMRGDLAVEVRAAMAHERAEQERLQQTEDWAEGVAAVRDRRAANFQGR
ncbi:MAG: enoyl-CoA hydratase/isomerase family protein [Desertimonas sp.]